VPGGRIELQLLSVHPDASPPRARLARRSEPRRIKP